MPQPILVAWIGFADQRASRGEPGQGLGPIAQAVESRQFSELHLLSDHAVKETQHFANWLRRRTTVDVVIHPAKLSGPTEFSEIYESAVGVVHGLTKPRPGKVHLVYHLSPGTPAMAAVWILLAKTIHPGGGSRTRFTLRFDRKIRARRIPKSKSSGVPFEIDGHSVLVSPSRAEDVFFGQLATDCLW